MTMLTIELDQASATDLQRLATQRHMTPTELATQMLVTNIMVESFDAARKTLQPFAAKAGYHCDADIFKGFS